MTLIAIDPGAKGGVAWCHRPHLGIHAVKMPGTEKDTVEIFTGILADRKLLTVPGDEDPGVRCVIEHVHAMPKQGVTSMFNFGKGYGFLRGTLVALGIPFEEVKPAQWQRPYGLLKRKDETNIQKKNRHKQKAQNLYPSLKLTHMTADAVMILHWLKEQEHAQARK